MNKEKWNKKSMKKKDSKEIRSWSKCFKNIDKSSNKLKSKNNKSNDNRPESKNKKRKKERSMSSK